MLSATERVTQRDISNVYRQRVVFHPRSMYGTVLEYYSQLCLAHLPVKPRGRPPDASPRRWQLPRHRAFRLPNAAKEREKCARIMTAINRERERSRESESTEFEADECESAGRSKAGLQGAKGGNPALTKCANEPEKPLHRDAQLPFALPAVHSQGIGTEKSGSSLLFSSSHRAHTRTSLREALQARATL